MGQPVSVPTGGRVVPTDELLNQICDYLKPSFSDIAGIAFPVTEK